MKINVGFVFISKIIYMEDDTENLRSKRVRKEAVGCLPAVVGGGERFNSNMVLVCLNLY